MLSVEKIVMDHMTINQFRETKVGKNAHVQPRFTQMKW